MSTASGAWEHPGVSRKDWGVRVAARGVVLLSTAVLLAGVPACASVSVRCGESCAGKEYPPAGHEVRYDDGLIVSTYPGEWDEDKKKLRFRIDLRNSGTVPIPGGRTEVRLFESKRAWTLRQHTHDHSLDQEIPAGAVVTGYVVLRTGGLKHLDVNVMVRPRDGDDMARWSVVV
ncbi:hypothetical protein HHL19_20645 [Streptomyces sp. R302]|uniref:hypothetical protein n=1 Tax=unclassified Streptomyces TaxID=2593676 RepID=UPI00145C6598|nr:MULTISPECIES: hypothetical protein [unclassified Streptomyces]NML50917.1 hypothetical protein [Streptomyces sp. R301]NML81011.1 hypothetical protein [Streptomyces sp. R302]